MGSTAGLWDSRFDGTTSSKPSLIDQSNSRFIDDSGESVAFYKSRENDHDVDIGDILAATKSELPFIGPRFLTFDRRLGNGTSFQVNRELYTKPLEQPYYVAVKHLQPKSRAEHLKHLYANVMRELRVLMHPPLKGHPCFIPAIGYGWTNQPMADSRPYLIMDYSEQGTLDKYLTNISLLSRRQLRELALDVAVGIRELHRNGFIHGDVKSENILVFESLSADRPHVAKLADFGAAFHRSDVEERGHRYLGTPRYNPPEMQESWKKVPFVPGPMEDAVAKIPELSTFESYKRADVYSFGLLLWEIMHKGRRFFDPAWANPGETQLDCLRRMFENDTDELRRRLYDSFDQSLDSIDDLREEYLVLTVAEAFLICVRDIPKLRPDMEEVVNVLSAGTK
ncbi:Phosphorylase b kinase gamma catalytic chain [Lasiodiplodia hormozganensis]|uniref:Phosphorylase b kinase gamma catalytic chain n=1 Tax=Lasiodiplodia hormozganensis TaxID=869390 RepID=A0AA39YDA1_9PEZI|nr:Phosphorylase b kinase gamma catalytic chain [Lasiodiplodia hormozganensis]